MTPDLDLGTTETQTLRRIRAIGARLPEARLAAREAPAESKACRRAGPRSRLHAGCLSGAECKNGWPLTEAAGRASLYSLQHLQDADLVSKRVRGQARGAARVTCRWRQVVTAFDDRRQLVDAVAHGGPGRRHRPGLVQCRMGAGPVLRPLVPALPAMRWEAQPTASTRTSVIQSEAKDPPAKPQPAGQSERQTTSPQARQGVAGGRGDAETAWVGTMLR